MPRGYFDRHYPPVEPRFWGYVNKLNSGCWEWNGHLDSGGYGIFYIHQKQHKAHRIAYQLFCREVPAKSVPVALV